MKLTKIAVTLIATIFLISSAQAYIFPTRDFSIDIPEGNMLINNDIMPCYAYADSCGEAGLVSVLWFLPPSNIYKEFRQKKGRELLNAYEVFLKQDNHKRVIMVEHAKIFKIHNYPAYQLTGNIDNKPFIATLIIFPKSGVASTFSMLVPSVAHYLPFSFMRDPNEIPEKYSKMQTAHEKLLKSMRKLKPKN